MCYDAPDQQGFICACPHNQKLDKDGRTCVMAVAADKLCDQWGICGQKCEHDKSSPHGYKCTCLDGFFLEPDEFTCKPLGKKQFSLPFTGLHFKLSSFLCFNIVF